MKRSMGFLAAAMTLMGMSAQAASGSQKEMAAVHASQKKPSAQMSKFVGSGDANPYKYTFTPKGNQRQKRKHMRQVPHMRKKYGK
jgi:outer membrane lipoprotein-sorting protein